MDLWILCQDKRSMCKATFLKICKNCFSEWCVFDNDNELGGYATEERALEVLGEIQKLLMENRLVFKNYDVPDYESLKAEIDYARKYGFFNVNSHSQVDICHRDCMVFEMPEN